VLVRRVLVHPHLSHRCTTSTHSTDTIHLSTRTFRTLPHP